MVCAGIGRVNFIAFSRCFGGVDSATALCRLQTEMATLTLPFYFIWFHCVYIQLHPETILS